MIYIFKKKTPGLYTQKLFLSILEKRVSIFWVSGRAAIFRKILRQGSLVILKAPLWFRTEEEEESTPIGRPLCSINLTNFCPWPPGRPRQGRGSPGAAGSSSSSPACLDARCSS
jgi:hypothetical protein